MNDENPGPPPARARLSRSRLGRRVARGLALAVILAFAGYSVWWWQAARLLDRQFQAWVADRQSRGDTVTWAERLVGGYPLSLTARLGDFQWRQADGTEWRGPSLVASAAPWAIGHIDITLDGAQTVTLPHLTATAQGGDGTIDWSVRAGRVLAARLALRQVAVTPAQAEPVPATAARVEAGFSQPDKPAQRHTDTGLIVDLTATTLHLPAPGLPLGPDVASLTFKGRLLGTPPAPVATALRAWSSDGGSAEIDALSVAWGPLTASAKGTVALDKGLQPEAALTARITGFNETIDALTAAGTLKPGNANMAKTALTMLARREAAADGPPAVQAPVTIQNGTLFLGPIKLARVPPLNWPET